MKRFTRFAMVGAIGFLVDALVLALLLAATPLGPFLSRIVSIGLAMATTWLLNRALTFGPSGRGTVEEGARYGLVALSVAGFNWLLYSALVVALPAIGPLTALALASAAAMLLSYSGYARLVFSRPQ
ncbi:MAG: GtrA family protein [Rhizobiaceae bacterium]